MKIFEQSRIEEIEARQILDSRGNPTLEVEVFLENGVGGVASVPSGVSTGKYEAVELRDKEENKYSGKGVEKAVSNVNEIIAINLVGEDACNQRNIDDMMLEIDGTENKSKLGANAILGVSMATAYAAAAFHDMPLYKYLGGINATTLPCPLMNILNGGAHADNKLDFQEFMIIPVASDTFENALRMGVEVFQNLKVILKSRDLSTSVGDEGGYAPQVSSNEEALEIVVDAINRAGYTTEQVKIGLDVASSELFQDGEYILSGENKTFNRDEMVNYLVNLTDKYPIISIEDGMAEEDWEGWKLLSERLGDSCQLVGDDLFVTNSKRLKEGIKQKVANSILIKPNQIGTVTETLNAIYLAKEFGYTPVISHRSGETENTFIADLAVGTNSPQIKTGSVSRSERVAKYNRLLKIEKELGYNSRFLGLNSFSSLKNPYSAFCGCNI